MWLLYLDTANSTVSGGSSSSSSNNSSSSLFPKLHGIHGIY